MKAMLIILLACVLPVWGAELFDFALMEPIRIKEADNLLNGETDGGSLSITLVDSNGKLGFVHYMTKGAGTEFGGGQLSYRRAQYEKGVLFANGSENEKLLLSILRSACLRTFGTSDPDALKNAPGGPDVFTRMAVGKLLGHFSLKKK